MFRQGSCQTHSHRCPPHAAAGRSTFRPLSHFDAQLIICGRASPKPTGVDSVFMFKPMYNMVKTRQLCNNEWLCNAFFIVDLTLHFVLLLSFQIQASWFSCIVDFLYNVENKTPLGIASTPPMFRCIIMLNINVLLATWIQIYTHVLQWP